MRTLPVIGRSLSAVLRSALVCGVASLGGLSTPVASGATLPVGTLSAVDAPGGCVSPAAQPGCTQLRGVDPDVQLQWVFARDGKNVYGVSYPTWRAGKQIDRPGATSIALLHRDPESGALDQLPGETGCASDAAGCSHALFVDGLVPSDAALALSPDGDFAYLAIRRGADAALIALTRDFVTGALTRLVGLGGCLSTRPHEGCTTVPASLLQNVPFAERPHDLRVDADGNSLSATAATGVDGRYEGAVVTIPRDPFTGALRAKGASCFAPLATIPGCRRLPRALGRDTGESQSSLILAPTGRSAYLWYGGDYSEDGVDHGALVAFIRDPVTGALSKPRGAFRCRRPGFDSGCTGPLGGWAWPWTAPQLTSQGQLFAAYGLFVGLYRQDSRAAGKPFALIACAAHRRRGCSSATALGAQFHDWRNTAASPDGRSFYVGSGYADPPQKLPSSVTGFQVVSGGTRLVQVRGSGGCWSPDGRRGCGRAPVAQPMMMLISHDGRSLYVLALGPHPPRRQAVLNVFRRDPGSGSLRLPRRPLGCLSALPLTGCTHVRDLGPTDNYSGTPGIDPALALTYDDKFLYASVGFGLRAFHRATP